MHFWPVKLCLCVNNIRGNKTNMGRGKALSAEEKASIDAYEKCGKSQREIAKLINRSRNVIYLYIKNRSNQIVKKKRGPRPKLSDRDKRKIVAAASQTTKGCRRIKNDVAPQVSKSTVHRVLKDSPNLVCEKMQKAPKLKPHHMQARYNFAEEKLHWTHEWSKVHT